MKFKYSEIMNGKAIFDLSFNGGIALMFSVFVLSFSILMDSYTKAEAESAASVSVEKKKTVKATLEPLIYDLLKSSTMGLNDREKRVLARTIVIESEQNNLDPFMVLALIETESSYYNWAKSSKGAKGLMQIMSFVGEALAEEVGIAWEGDKTLFNPNLNVKMGTFYLSKLLSSFDRAEHALTAYNHGPTKIGRLVRQGKKVPSKYSNKVLGNYSNLYMETKS